MLPVYIVLFINTFIVSLLGANIGGPCLIENGKQNGTCQLRNDCKGANSNTESYQTCDNIDSVVCCPQGDISLKTIHKRSTTIGEKSKLKCKEYSKYSNTEKKDPTKENCNFHDGKILDGGKAAEKEFPHMAALGYIDEEKNETFWLCGGILISEQYIITNAYCLFSRSYGAVKIAMLGVHNLKNLEHAQKMNVIETIQHPNYKVSSYYNDIGLVKVEKPLSLNLHVRPACLYTETQIPFKRASSVGWGAANYAEERSDNLLKVGYELISTDTCNAVYNATSQRRLMNGIDEKTQICVTPLLGQNDICGGGAGGPLQVYNTEVACTYLVFGMNSFGKHCVAGKPSVFTKLPAFVPWIESIVWP